MRKSQGTTIFKAEKPPEAQELVASDITVSGAEMRAGVGQARRIKEKRLLEVCLESNLHFPFPATDNYCLIPRKYFISGEVMERGLGLGTPQND